MLSKLKRLYSRFSAKRRPFRLTKGGWVFILYTVGVGAGAINTGNNLLYLVFGIFLGLILASGVLSDLAIWKLTAELEFPNATKANTPGLISLNISNHKRWIPSLSITVIVEGTLRGKPVQLKKYLPVLYPGQSVSTHLVFKPKERGWFELTQLKFATRFPFGLLYKWWLHSRPRRAASRLSVFSAKPNTRGARTKARSGSDDRREEAGVVYIPSFTVKNADFGVMVYPRTWELSHEEMSFRSSGDQTFAQKDRRGDGTSVYGIREFKESDNPKRIHWKASARRASWALDDPSAWLVREMQADEKDDMILRWPSLSQFPTMHPDDVEGLIQFTASLIESFQAQKKDPYLLVPVETESAQTKLYRIRATDSRDQIRGALEFLSLFDAKKPTQELTMKFLEVDRDRTDADFSRDDMDVLAQYMMWAKDVRHAA